ncbi:MAG: BON domain-containing protein [Candidatus Eisenbacteria bacterium]
MSKILSLTLLTLTLALSACGSANDPQKANDEGRRPAADQQANNQPAVNGSDQDAMPTPTDQGTSATDIAITRSIRQALMEGEGLSLDAKNIKVITLEGVVALRGQVVSEEERTEIGAVAGDTPGVTRVVNLLELKRSDH